MKKRNSIRTILSLVVASSILGFASQCKEADSSPSAVANTWTSYGVEANTMALATGGNTVVTGTFNASESGNLSGIAYVYSGTSNGWQVANAGLPNQAITALGVFGNSLFLGTADATPGAGIYLSSDNGNSWSAANNGLPSYGDFPMIGNGVNGVTAFVTMEGNVSGRITTAPGHAKIFAGTGVGVFATADNGGSWQSVNNGLVANGVSALATNDSRLFAGIWRNSFGGGVYVSDDNGSSWHEANVGLEGTGEIYALAAKGDTIFASTTSSAGIDSSGGVYISHDNGAHWKISNTGLTRSVSSFATNGHTIYAGTNGAGVFISTNNGQSWTAINNGLTETQVNSIVIFNGTLLAATHSGIFALPVR